MFKHVIISAFILTACLFLAIPVFRDEKEITLRSMVQYGQYDGMYYGSSEIVSRQWKNYQALKRLFSEEELIGLCGHAHPVVRCYSFKALTERCSLKAYDVLLKHLSDTAAFDRNSGCFTDKDRVMDNFLDHVGYDKDWPTEYVLTENEYNYIDSVLLFGEQAEQRSRWGSMEYRSGRYMLERIKPVPQFYERIRELVMAEVSEALPLLARYKNPQDTTLFKELLLNDEFSNKGRTLKNNVRRAVMYFPHPSFYPVLKELLIAEVGTNNISDSYESFPLYTALVQYPTKETRELFEKVLAISGDERWERTRSIRRAIRRFPSPVFDGVVEAASPGEDN